MSDLDASTPRVFLARHGETEWAKIGRYTGTTDIELTPIGVEQVSSTGAHLVGPGRLIDPSRLAHIWVSPRKRAQTTLELLFGSHIDTLRKAEKVTTTEDIAEWNYGEYEGLVESEIREGRKRKGLDVHSAWNIWQDGCECGESAQQVTERLDNLISDIQEIQRPCMDGEKPADVILVAHGHILRAFAKRWLKYSMETPLPMMMSPGAIGVLSYRHRDINDRAFFLGISIPSKE